MISKVSHLWPTNFNHLVNDKERGETADYCVVFPSTRNLINLKALPKLCLLYTVQVSGIWNQLNAVINVKKRGENGWEKGLNLMLEFQLNIFHSHPENMNKLIDAWHHEDVTENMKKVKWEFSTTLRSARGINFCFSILNYTSVKSECICQIPTVVSMSLWFVKLTISRVWVVPKLSKLWRACVKFKPDFRETRWNSQPRPKMFLPNIRSHSKYIQSRPKILKLCINLCSS